MIVTEPNFQYKYVLLEKPDTILWEEGVNRIADLNILPVDDKVKAAEFKRGGEFLNVKNVVLNDYWEELNMRFTIFDPSYDNED